MWMKGAEGTKPLAKSPFFGCVSAGTKNGKAVRARHEDKVRLLLRVLDWFAEGTLTISFAAKPVDDGHPNGHPL